MASNKQFRVEIRMSEDVELATTVLFYQKLLSLVAKFGVTYFGDVVVLENYRELARYETTSHMNSAIKEFHEDKLREQTIKQKSFQIDSIDEATN